MDERVLTEIAEITSHYTVTVVVSVYNFGIPIRQCLEGIINQRVSYKFCALVHDDCSTDTSREIIEDYVAKYPEVVYPIYETENQFSQGIPWCSILIRHINSKYIAICEGDDYWCDQSKLQTQYDYMEQHEECSLCAHNTIMHDLSGEIEDTPFFDIDGIKTLSTEVVFDAWPVHTSSYFIRNTFEVCPEWCQDYWSGDYAMLTIAHSEGHVDTLPDVMSVYNFNNPTGATARSNKSGELNRIKATRERAEYLYKFLANVCVDIETESVIKRRIKVIEEATATDEFIYEIGQKLQSRDSSDNIAWLVDRLNDPLVKAECINPAYGTENRGSEQRILSMFNHIIELTGLNETYDNIPHTGELEFIYELIEIYGKKNKDNYLIQKLIDNPFNRIGWGDAPGGSKNEPNLLDPKLFFLIHNYDYCYLKGRLEKAISYQGHNGTLVLGSSQGLLDFDDMIYPDSFNCSMFSQDLYYSYKCAKYVLDRAQVGRIKKCFIILDYNIGFFDSSSGNNEEKERILKVYYPILGDAHHLKGRNKNDLWGFLNKDINDAEKDTSEYIAVETLKTISYFSNLKSRKNVSDDFCINDICRKETFEENEAVFRSLIEYLGDINVRPIVIVAPSLKAIKNSISKKDTDNLFKLMNSTECDIDYVDLNNQDLFAEDDFTDPYHLNDKGASKLMGALYELFG
ncbi:Glycosyl transferase family 2 [Lachnospiraceae bacterium XBB2008]|nr:Glycosyl transferase family 2 [Lachnospiraceae bacterium XBB2008]